MSELRQTFGAGESEAIVIAEELKTTLYADEREVIMEARRRGITITSTIDMLLTAKERGFIGNVQKILDVFMDTGFRIDDALYAYALNEAGEGSAC